jgi:Zn-dependent M16 (insulinase) family peptidase
MSLLDELQEEVEKRTPLKKIRAKIKALRKKAQEAFNAQFLLSSENNEQQAFLKGKIAAFDECLELFVDEKERAREQKRKKWRHEE